MIFLKKAAVIVFLLAVLISANGISMQSHSCSMSSRTTQTLFPGVFGAKASCCCSSEYSLPPAGTNLQRTPCCKNTFKYLRLPTYSDHRASFSSAPRTILALPAYFIIRLITHDDGSNVLVSDYLPPPPKLAGKALLNFIRQLKFHLSL